MKKENFEFLLQLDDHFYTVEKAGYSRAVSKMDRKELKRIIEEETGKPSDAKTHCSSCLVSMFTTLLPLYKAEKEKLNNKSQTNERKKKSWPAEIISESGADAKDN